jgi:hypothetical protein
MSTAGDSDFDDYCARHNISPQEYGPAFAAWLNESSDGEWDDRAERVL